MTRPWLALSKALINVNFGFSALRAQFRRRHRLWEPLLIGFSIVFGAFAVALLVAQFANWTLAAAIGLGQPEIVLTLAHSLAALIVFFFGVAFVMGSFYFSEDTQTLVPWPLRPWEIVSAKFVTILINEYLTIAIILLPVYAVYAWHVEVGALFFPTALIVFLLTPVMPLALASLLVVALMRVVGLSKKRDFLTLLGGLVLIVGALLFQNFVQTQLPEAEMIELIVSRAHGLSQVVSRGYPPAYWATLSLVQGGTAGGLAAIGGYVVASLAVVAGLLAAGERLFLRAAQAAGESRSKGRRRAVSLVGGSPIRSIARAEAKLFLRTPVYVLNGFGGLIAVSFIAFLPQFSDAGAIEELISAGLISPTVGVIVLWAWFAAAAGLSVIPATAVSREGRRIWVFKALPVTGKTFFLGKLVGSQALVMLGALPGAAVLAYVMRLPIGAIIMGVLFGNRPVLTRHGGLLAIDMMRPWLSWTDPTRAVKSNVNALFGMLASAVLIALPAVMGYGIVALQGFPMETAMTLVAGIHGIVLIVGWRLLAPKLDPLLRRMGD